MRAGDEVGDHTYNHLGLPTLSDAGVKQELAWTQRAVRAATGVTPIWFHPPYGAIDSRVVADASTLGLRPVLWSIDSRDWSLPGTSAIVERVLSAVRPGSIVLLHDGGGDRSETVAALPVILRTLESKGYRFLSLSALFNLPGPSSCNEAVARTWFASAGIAPEPRHAIFTYWLQSYCHGNNYGPATSEEYGVGSTGVAQAFARTAHRLEWHRTTGAIHVTLEWKWAAEVFSERGIQPRWGTPITHAWFNDYFRGYNHGPAVGQPSTRDRSEIQCFTPGCATARSNRVTWREKAL